MVQEGFDSPPRLVHLFTTHQASSNGGLFNAMPYWEQELNRLKDQPERLDKKGRLCKPKFRFTRETFSYILSLRFEHISLHPDQEWLTTNKRHRFIFTSRISIYCLGEIFINNILKWICESMFIFIKTYS